MKRLPTNGSRSAGAAGRAAFLGIGAVLAAGCMVPRTPPPQHLVPPPAWLKEPLPIEYKLDVGDLVDLKLYYHPDLSDHDVLVRPDGKIFASLLGDVNARGLTPGELAKDLQDRYDGLRIERPDVAVIVRKSAGTRVFVGGEVNNPGMMPHDGWMTVSRAIFQAGGL